MYDEKPKVVYVMGAGRSGSTILGVTLGNCENVFFAGELARWLRRKGRSPFPGEDRARFWGVVSEHVNADVSASEARSLEASSAALRVRNRRAQRRLRKRYRRVAQALYVAVARAAGATHVVDTSHFPRRARELQALDGIDLYLLFLIRRPQSIVASYLRRDVIQGPKFNLFTTNAYLWLTYTLSLFVFLRQPRERRMLVRHEEFVANPEGVLREILDSIGAEADIPDLQSLETGVAFLGNRMARSDVVVLKGRPEEPSRESRFTALVQLPWAIIFSLLHSRGYGGVGRGGGYGRSLGKTDA